VYGLEAVRVPSTHSVIVLVILILVARRAWRRRRRWSFRGAGVFSHVVCDKAHALPAGHGGDDSIGGIGGAGALKVYGLKVALLGHRLV